MTIHVGEVGEDAVADFLSRGGWSILDRNWRCTRGELDIVAFDPDRQAIVAVEVKTRRTQTFGQGLESITGRKRQRLRELLARWLLTSSAHADSVAVDAVSVDWIDGRWSMTHLKDI